MNMKIVNEITKQAMIDLNKNDSDTYKQIRQNKIVQKAIHWCLVNGLISVPRELTPKDLISVSYIPFTLYPSPFKRRIYEQVVDLQPDINTLMYKIANSHKYLEKNFTNLAKFDRFISSLWNIYQKSLAEGYNQKIFLQILRVDYMCHQSGDSGKDEIKQVEINTMASGMGYNAGRVSLLHRQVLKWSNYTNILPKLLANEPIQKIAQGFIEAWKMYNVREAIILFIVLDWEVNLSDQRRTEYEIISKETDIQIQRCTLKEMYQYGYVDENKVLYFDNQEVAIVYYRAGYAPSHFQTEKEWIALTNIELSKAIKCPNVASFLAGMKKIQEFLVHDKNALNSLCDNDSTVVRAHKSVFAEFLNLKNQSDFERVFNNPNDFVLKPQREGGGNNYYKKEIKDILLKMIDNKEVTDRENEDLLNKERYIVMELLKAPITENILVTPKMQQKFQETGNLHQRSKITNELGIFGVLVRNETEVVLNETCGYLMRSKLAEYNEGGVMSGSGALDSIYFID